MRRELLDKKWESMPRHRVSGAVCAYALRRRSVGDVLTPNPAPEFLSSDPECLRRS